MPVNNSLSAITMKRIRSSTGDFIHFYAVPVAVSAFKALANCEGCTFICAIGTFLICCLLCLVGGLFTCLY